MTVFILALFAVTGAGWGVIGAPGNTGPQLHLQAGTLSPLPLVKGSSSALSFLKPGAQTALLQFTGPVEEAWKASVRVSGLKLLRYIPDYGYVVRGEGAALRHAAQYPFIRWIGPYLPEYRISPALNLTGSLSVLLALEAGADLNAITSSAEEKGLSVEKTEGGLLRVSGEAALIRALANHEDIAWINPTLSPQPMNDRSRAIIGVNPVWNDVGLYGEGQLIGIADTGLDTGNPDTLTDDFKGRVETAFIRVPGRDWADQFGHGTHIAGTIAGQGKALTELPEPNSYAGVAPRAKLVVQGMELDPTGYFGFPDDLNELFDQAYGAGARVHNNSWGDDFSPYGSYSLHSRQVDEFIWNHPDMTLVFSAGNDGSDSPPHGSTPRENRPIIRNQGDGIIQPGTLYAPGTAKNAITVGASEGYRPPEEDWGGYSNSTWSTWRFAAAPISTDYTSDHPEGLVAFSSRGPTLDGRIKPDLVAPGSNIISTASPLGSHGLWGSAGGGYRYNGGTSMSTGFVSGAAALVRQWYMDRQGITPSAALIKATLLNGARELAPGQYGTGAKQEIPLRPNGAEGWGRVDVVGAVAPSAPLAVRFLEEKTGFQTQQTRRWKLIVREGGQPLRVMLAWSDYPGAAEAAVALVNDLDLIVTGPDGTPLPGNGQPDRRNNVEAVNLDSASPGIYEVTVSGYNIPQGPQPFALTMRGAASPFIQAGDVDLNGSIDINDAVRALQSAMSLIVLSREETLAGDLVQEEDSTGKVDIRDAVLILQGVVGLVTL